VRRKVSIVLVSTGRKQFRRLQGVDGQFEIIGGHDKRLYRRPNLKILSLRLMEECGRGDQREHDTGGAKNQQKASALAIDKHHADERHQEVDPSEDHIAPVGCQVRKSALQQDTRVVPNDRVDARRRIAGKDHAGQQKWYNILAPEQGTGTHPARVRMSGNSGHLCKLEVSGLGIPRSQQRGECLVSVATAEKPAGRLCDEETAKREEHTRRQRHPEDVSPCLILNSKKSEALPVAPTACTR